MQENNLHYSVISFLFSLLPLKNSATQLNSPHSSDIWSFLKKLSPFLNRKSFHANKSKKKKNRMVTKKEPQSLLHFEAFILQATVLRVGGPQWAVAQEFNLVCLFMAAPHPYPLVCISYPHFICHPTFSKDSQFSVAAPCHIFVTGPHTVTTIILKF